MHIHLFALVQLINNNSVVILFGCSWSSSSALGKYMQVVAVVRIYPQQLQHFEGSLRR